MLLTGCEGTILSGRTELLCAEKFPTFTESELNALSDRTINEVDNYFATITEICRK